MTTGIPDPKGLALSLEGYQDAHEQAHANDIRKRFTNREVTTGQIIVFGLTGGLDSSAPRPLPSCCCVSRSKKSRWAACSSW